MQTRSGAPSCEEHLAIQTLVNRFENAFDQGDLDAHMATWGEEITFRSPFGDFDDHSSYREWASAFTAQTREQGGTRHLISKRCDGRIYNPAFNDVLLRSDNGWRFRQLRLESDQS